MGNITPAVVKYFDLSPTTAELQPSINVLLLSFAANFLFIIPKGNIWQHKEMKKWRRRAQQDHLAYHGHTSKASTTFSMSVFLS
jgi:hypothetical protein